MSSRLLPVIAVALVSLPIAQASEKAYADALADFRATTEVAAMMDESHAYALFPTVGKGGIGIGGAYGQGRVYRGGKHIADTSVTKVSFGLQLGGQAFSELILFRNADALDEFSSGKFAFGAEASAVALTAGASAGANSMGSSASASDSKPGGSAVGGWNGSMAVFVLAKGGLMYEASVGGQGFTYTPVGKTEPAAETE
jgi:lipid-binding SYLF domain-containing protein